MKSHPLFSIFSILIFSLSTFHLNGQPTESLTSQITAPTDLLTEMTFEDLEYNFGTVQSGDIVTHFYRFTNTGDTPLIISNAKGTCGCTVPEWPNEPILPGEEGIIEVSFDSSNKSGLQSKRVTITANTNPKQTFLTVRGKVEKVLEREIEPENLDLAIDTKKEKIESDGKNCFAIFPNPTADILKLDLKENLGKSALVQIYSPQGKLMTQKQIDKVEGIVEFDVSNYVAGTYVANVQVDNQRPIAHCFIRL